MPVITLTTDFGQKDGFVGTLKGVIWGICPKAQIADISHEITPRNILEGALVLWHAYSFFPAGTTHVAVVDPGVGTKRRPIAIGVNGHVFIGPDNGLFTPILLDAEKFNWRIESFQLTNEKYFLPVISRTFHGRDIFAPVAAHLANGIPLSELGPAISDPVHIDLLKPEKTPTGWQAHIISVDRFGNLATDLPADWIKDREKVSLWVGRFEVCGISDTYGAGLTGELLALSDSTGRLELAVVNGNAAQTTGAQVGDIVKVVE
jgi:S-adenosylmethionine hydrolase